MTDVHPIVFTPPFRFKYFFLLLSFEKVLRLDKNPLTNISVFLLDHPNLAKLQWLYLPR